MEQQLYTVDRPRRITLVLVALLATLFCVSTLAEGEEVPQIPDESPDVTNPEAVPEDECDWKLKDQELQEQSREVLRSWSCHSFRWFDSLWGDSHDYPEDQVKGWLIAGASYRKFDNFDPRLRFRVRAPLPNMNRRWDIILGRVDETAFVSDTQTDDKKFFNPGTVNQRDADPEWLLGLGHRGRNRKRGWDWSAGVRLRTPPNPYAKLQWYYNKNFSENVLLNFRQTFFWRSDDGFGTTSRGVVTHEINDDNYMRYEGIITRAEESEGNEWFYGTTWFHRLEGESAISLLLFAQGESDNEVPLQDAGLNLIWRRPFTREWVFLSMGPSLTWPREFASDKREMNIGFGVWIEIEFGDWTY